MGFALNTLFIFIRDFLFSRPKPHHYLSLTILSSQITFAEVLKTLVLK